jgi:hypothetical protein
MKPTTIILLLTILSQGGFLLYVLFKKKAAPAPDPKAQALADAQAQVAKLVAEKGAEAAVEQIKKDYAGAIAKLDQAQKDKANALEKDPAALVDLILRGS